MPSDEENIQFLYLVLTANNSTIDFEAVGNELDLKKGAVSKRWSRLKQAMADGKNPGPSAYQFLWSCGKHSTRDGPLDWQHVAKECSTTPGAASKRYSRMKQAFDNDAAASTPSKAPAPAAASAREKRKRTAHGTKKTKLGRSDENFKLLPTEEDGRDESPVEKKVKRSKVGKPDPRVTFKAAGARNNKGTAVPAKFIKEEPIIKDEPIEKSLSGSPINHEHEDNTDETFESVAEHMSPPDVDEAAAQERVNEWLGIV